MPDIAAPLTARIGLGISGPLGATWFDEKKARDLIAEAISLGVTRFDTSPLYGVAEERLGAVIKSLPGSERARLRVSTKVGNFLSADGKRQRDFSGDTIRHLVYQSLSRLGLDTLDILYLHGPNEHELFPSLDVLRGLQEAGLIRQTGVCSEGSHLALAAHQQSVTALMGSYNILDRRHARLFDDAQKAGQNVTAIAPLAQGLYRRSFFMPRSFADGWYLARALAKNRDRLAGAQRLRWMHKIEDWDAPSLALAFVLANPAIDCAMLTTTRIEHLRANLAVADRPLPDDLYTRLAAITPES